LYIIATVSMIITRGIKMTHNREHGFVIAVLSNGKVLREQHGQVFIPFGSEYTIRIKNPTYARVGVVIDVDGSTINQNKIVVDANSTVDIKRMCVDGDLNAGPALKFVELGHNSVQDPSNNDNGIIKVAFYKEARSNPRWWDSTEQQCALSNPIGGMYGPIRRNASASNSTLYTSSASSTLSSRSEAGISGAIRAMHATQSTVSGLPGATVPGKETEQQFRTIDITFETEPTATMTLRMRGNSPYSLPQEQLPPSKQYNQRFCTSCGVRIAIKDNYCANCGTRNSSHLRVF